VQHGFEKRQAGGGKEIGRHALKSHLGEVYWEAEKSFSLISRQLTRPEKIRNTNKGKKNISDARVRASLGIQSERYVEICVKHPGGDAFLLDMSRRKEPQGRAESANLGKDQS